MLPGKLNERLFVSGLCELHSLIPTCVSQRPFHIEHPINGWPIIHQRQFRFSQPCHNRLPQPKSAHHSSEKFVLQPCWSIELYLPRVISFFVSWTLSIVWMTGAMVDVKIPKRINQTLRSLSNNCPSLHFKRLLLPHSTMLPYSFKSSLSSIASVLLNRQNNFSSWLIR